MEYIVVKQLVLSLKRFLWWVARDVCEVLNIKDARQAMEGLDEDERCKTPVIDSRSTCMPNGLPKGSR